MVWLQCFETKVSILVLEAGELDVIVENNNPKHKLRFYQDKEA